MSVYDYWRANLSQVDLSIQIAAQQARASAATAEKQARDQAAAQRYNQGGNAYSLHTLQSRGLGDVDVTQPVTFQVMFVTEPFFTSGAAVVLPLPANATRVPWASATVRSWVRDDSGNYSGALISLHVSAPEQISDEDGIIDSADYTMTHYLMFQAAAYKDLGQQAIASIQTVAPKTPGFGI